METGKYIKMLRTQRGLSQEDLGRLVGVQRAAVQKWESGATQNLKRTTIKRLADFFEVSPVMFIDSNNLPQPEIAEEYVEFPVIGEVAAGYESIAVEDWTGDKVKIPTDYLIGHDKDDFFVLRVKGDSMYPQYHEGDKVLVLKQSTLNYSGQIGVAVYGDENATLKKIEYAQGEDWLKLVPINPNHPTVRIENESLEHCRVLGIPKLLIREIND